LRITSSAATASGPNSGCAAASTGDYLLAARRSIGRCDFADAFEGAAAAILRDPSVAGWRPAAAARTGCGR
jgi:hypothetical protein